ncbi:integrase [Streptomyces sp. BR123]|uniref:integrase n=1 Tax=Streptomyces sp. BR123 TaxID=2749828 RepID=UPI0015C427F1|nr:integrase [Streptomyces sp. BR123]NXY98674.1 integrase [Streptomyces sp. BR123]
MCKSCYENSPHTVQTRAAGWACRMPAVPAWWDPFTAHLQTHRHTFYAADAITHTARLILKAGTTDPATLLHHAQHATPWLVRPLADFFRTHHLHDAPGTAEDARAAALRERRIEAVPAPLRPAVRAFARALVDQRERAAALGLRPNRLKTIEIRLDTVRDLALHAEGRGHRSWASVTTTDLEAFLARNPARRASWLAGLRQFFAHAHRTGVVLHNPAAPLDALQARGFRGATLTLDEQRILYHRWNGNGAMQPHEAFIGLAALLHAATTTELRLLALDHLTPARHAVRFPGRSVDLVLDTATWKALVGCLGHRSSLGTDNPHVLVTRLTRTTQEPAGAAHIRDSLAPVGLLPRVLRSTRLVTLAAELDIKQLTAALGMSYNGAAHYV